jgi:hypothetical protein
VLIWNERRTGSTPFLRDYEQLLLTYGTDYKEVRHERTTAMIHEFFAPARCKERVFSLCQQFDYEGAAGTTAVFFVCAAGRSSQPRADDAGIAADLSRPCQMAMRSNSNTTRGCFTEICNW